MKRFKSIILFPFAASSLLATFVSCNKPKPDPAIRINLVTDRVRTIDPKYTSIYLDTSFDFDFNFQLTKRYHHSDDYVTIRMENYSEAVDWRKDSEKTGSSTKYYLIYELGEFTWISHEEGLFYYPFKIKVKSSSSVDYIIRPIYTYSFDLVVEYVSVDGQYCSTNTFKDINLTIDTWIEI